MRPVHPRVCGEHRDARRAERPADGSSPRVRGTLWRGSPSGWKGRFIPACAGNTWRFHHRGRKLAVHPRVCGEHSASIRWRRSAIGSSPRVRGTQQAAIYLIFHHRFIPACAGNTDISYLHASHSPVHPRVCGEHRCETLFSRSHVGSSPRVRGTRTCVGLSCGIPRFIPACAGNTSVAKTYRRSRSVHPRVCGEHSGWKILI